MTTTTSTILSFPELPAKLARLVSFPTVSSYNPGEENEEAFTALKRELPALFPLVHAGMKVEEPSDRALLFSWKGKDPSIPPAILCAHFDVVPAGNPSAWKHPPFSGDIADGEVWGRGTQDIKVIMASLLEAAERLIGEGFAPKRTIYFAFGGDEEIGGQRGAAAIAAHLAASGIKASFLADEGGPISVGMIAFAKKPLALVGVAEKGYADFRLSVKGSGGHASMPPRHTAPGNLARAISAIEDHPFPSRITPTMKAFLARLAPESRQPYRFLFKQLWFTAPAIKAAFASAPTTNALIRTTAACTMLKGSSKENVLADAAEATLNVRILPGESSQAVLARLRNLAAPFGAEVSIKHKDHVVEPSGESGTDHEGWKAIEAALSTSHPEAACIPFLFSAATDTKHYRNIVEATYRFTPLMQSQQDLKGVHGDNERVKVEELDRCAIFYRSLMEKL
ncbi:MAG: M20/M25/M40 family metallo-hydrolase [Rectinemataceae bacterium]|nr:M20/M25/M40 family metallo-hydrolase [Rectinemataceae bacterium]